ncbi:MAG: hypothetical protein SFV81_08320 [Pirellulaceae bacterium]|nr:hypothetical protein [Pirellulaceae bacterium]
MKHARSLDLVLSWIRYSAAKLPCCGAPHGQNLSKQFGYKIPPAGGNIPVGDADYWIIEYEFGLLLGFEFVHACDGGHVCATEPNVNHAVEHLVNWKQKIPVYSDDAFKLDREWALEHFSKTMPESQHQACCQAWRQSDDGNPMTIGYPTSERDAKCLIRELESRGHKQIYWVENL